MGEQVFQREVGGWAAPCEPFDYRGLEKEARQEYEAIRSRMDILKQEKPQDQERELLWRRELRILTDMYYEQKHMAGLFQQRAEYLEGLSRGEKP